MLKVVRLQIHQVHQPVNRAEHILQAIVNPGLPMFLRTMKTQVVLPEKEGAAAVPIVRREVVPARSHLIHVHHPAVVLHPHPVSIGDRVVAVQVDPAVIHQAVLPAVPAAVPIPQDPAEEVQAGVVHQVQAQAQVQAQEVVLIQVQAEDNWR